MGVRLAGTKGSGHMLQQVAVDPLSTSMLKYLAASYSCMNRILPCCSAAIFVIMSIALTLHLLASTEISA